MLLSIPGHFENQSLVYEPCFAQTRSFNCHIAFLLLDEHCFIFSVYTLLEVNSRRTL